MKVATILDVPVRMEAINSIKKRQTYPDLIINIAGTEKDFIFKSTEDRDLVYKVLMDALDWSIIEGDSLVTISNYRQ